MKVCFTWLAIIGLAVWNVGCGSADSETITDPMMDAGTDLGVPGGIEPGSQTPGMDEDTSPDTSVDVLETDGPELPETTEE